MGDLNVRSEAVAALESRRAGHGIPVAELARLAGVDRNYLAKALKGQQAVSDTFLGKITRALERFEDETGSNGDVDLVEFRVAGNFGVTAVVKGPVRNMPELEAAVGRLIAQMQDKAAQDDTIHGDNQ
jgi:transcriptional regulator with XRE-family HTH domain